MAFVVSHIAISEAYNFAIAASLGRLVSEANGAAFGAAHGSQSRWSETQRANAFAAEFLLPTVVLQRSDDLAGLCERYGISRSAAEWHRANRIDAKRYQVD